jgi:hypothetical protein
MKTAMAEYILTTEPPTCQWHLAEAVTNEGSLIMGKGSSPCPRTDVVYLLDEDSQGLFICLRHVEVLRQAGARVGDEHCDGCHG